VTMVGFSQEGITRERKKKMKEPTNQRRAESNRLQCHCHTFLPKKGRTKAPWIEGWKPVAKNNKHSNKGFGKCGSTIVGEKKKKKTADGGAM